MDEILFSRTSSVAETIERFIRKNKSLFDAALYRFNNQRLARVLGEARKRGIRIRLVLDRTRYGESKATQELLEATGLPFRLVHGRQGPGSKMHHKFALLDEEVVLTGSYNWTLASEEQNCTSKSTRQNSKRSGRQARKLSRPSLHPPPFQGAMVTAVGFLSSGLRITRARL